MSKTDGSILKKMGLKRGWIYETIISTSDGFGFNAAPMGVYTKDCKTVNLEVYRTSKTCKNIKKQGKLAVNFTSNILTFYDALKAKEKIRYCKVKGIPVMRGADACLILNTRKTKSLNGKILINAEILDYRIKKTPRLINRAEYLTLESLVKATKIPFLPKKRKEKLLDEIRENRRIIGKVAPKSVYGKIISLL